MSGDERAGKTDFHVYSPARRDRRILLPLIASVAVATSMVLWFRPGSTKHSGQDAPVDSQSTKSSQSPPSDAVPSTPEINITPAQFVSMDILRGGGLTAQKFITSINAANGHTVEWENPDVQKRAADIQLSEYEGDGRISVPEALNILTLCGFAVETRENNFIIRELKSEELLWGILSSKVDPDSPDWGALRPWRSLRFCDARSLDSILNDSRSTTPGSSAALAWASGGGDRTINISDDGFVRRQVNVKLNDSQMVTVVSVLEGLKDNPAYSANPALRVAAARVLGEVLGRDPVKTLTPDNPTLMRLETLLADPDGQVASSAALALGRSASVPSLNILVKTITSTNVRPQVLPCALAALWQSELLGRRLDSESLGQAIWESRRDLFSQVRNWIVESSAHIPTNVNCEYAAAWLLTAAQFASDSIQSECGTALRAVLKQSSDPRAQWIAASLEGLHKADALEPLPGKLRTGCVAGPLWLRYTFSSSLARELLTGADRRDVQSALWRLSKPQALLPDNGIEGDNLFIARRALSLAQNDPSPILRNLALNTLYRERRTPAPENREWRLYNETGLALSVFMTDADPVCQLTAASALAQLGGPSEIAALGRKDTAHPAEAWDRLLTGLVQRMARNDEQLEFLAPAVVDLADALLPSSNEAIATRAAWTRMHDPSLTGVARIRMIKSFHSAPQREAAVRALAETSKRDVLSEKDIAVLMSDEDPRVRAAVLDTGLAGKKMPKH